MTQLVPVILSGGSGSRLWPLSRAQRPKQFLALTGDNSLFQQTLERVCDIEGHQAQLSPIVVANTDHRFLVAEQCREMAIEPMSLILEPVARNTAPAIAVAAMAAMQRADDPVMLVLPSDHTFSDVAALHRAVGVGLLAAQSGSMVVFGITPTYPETGYGYVKARKADDHGVHAVEAFVEKPNLGLARSYIEQGGYYWNSGMFMFRASVYLQELTRHRPEMVKACQGAWDESTIDLEFVRLNKEAFASSPSDSIDFAVMEKTNKAVVIPLDAGWSDVGAWSAVWQVQDRDTSGNAIKGDVLIESSTNSYVNAQSRMVAIVGMDNVVVVETSDAVLVMNKDKSQDVKKLVDQLKSSKRSEVDLHREVFRPWGSYDSIDHGKRFQVKRITVKPSAKLSVQMHHHRAEHWVVVSGTARVRVGDKTQLITENQSVYIPVGEVHSLENPGKVPLHLIEVQTGSYLGEDDIVRLEDLYGRA
ncbi:MAG: mannose-1-phosphate guanylyltransferase/mannose-6-phosphate isomerase [Betaproteobacteria bacterium]|nr:mannose-1-phosphate guanylyltransferase/mannose-6-phosphate isomerase [Betaproteobacteria bacterium]